MDDLKLSYAPGVTIYVSPVLSASLTRDQMARFKEGMRDQAWRTLGGPLADARCRQEQQEALTADAWQRDRHRGAF